MALVIADRVLETSSTTGTGTLTLNGAVAGYQGLATAIGDGNTTYYTITLDSANEWEVGIGTYTTSGSTLSRDTVLDSSNSGSLVNFGAGTKQVFVTYPGGKAVYQQDSGDVVLPENLTFTGTGNRITGDFSNATVASRVAFQTSTTNGNTSVGILPNGTAVTASISAFNNSDLTNAGFIGLSLNASGATVSVDRNSVSGTYLPLSFNTGGSERLRIATSGVVSVGVPPSSLDLSYSSGAGRVTGGLSLVFSTVLNTVTTERMCINSEGAVSFNGSFGTSGQVLASGGSASFPTWITPPVFPVGTIVGTTDTQTLTNKTFGDTPVETIFALTDASTVDIDPANGSIQTLTLTSTGRTLTFTNMVAGEAITLMINDGTAGTITTWNATFVNNGGVAPVLSTTGFTVVVLWKVSTVVYAAVVGNA